MELAAQYKPRRVRWADAPRLLVTLGWMVLGAIPLTAAAEPAWLAGQQAFQQKNEAALAAARDRLASTPLAAYGPYWQARLALAQDDDRAVQTFLTQESGTWLAELSRRAWIEALGRRGDWPGVRREVAALRAEPPLEILCWSLQADAAAGQFERLPAMAERLWLTAQDLPSACTPLHRLLFERGILTAEARWWRWRLAADAAATGLQRFLAQQAGEAWSAEEAEQAVKAPAAYLQRTGLTSRLQREWAARAYGRWARTETDAAVAHLRAQGDRWGAQTAEAWRQIALAAARRFDPRAEAYFVLSQASYWPLAHREVRLRQRIRHGDWSAVLSLIDTLPEAEQQRRTWRFWRARAQLALQGLAPARAALASLSVDEDFYGLWAKSQLGPTMSAVQPAPLLTRADRARFAEQVGFQRALALFDADQRTAAAAEWNWAARQADDGVLRVAAEVAAARQWYDRAIFAAERIQGQPDPQARYLMPFREPIVRHARQQALPEAWVFGLIRQESRFLPAVTSAVGAGGLMQVMPATAAWIDRQIGQPHQPSRLRDPDENLRLGTWYLRYVHDRFGHPVYATAAYNAGPGRILQWRPDQPMDALQFIESIPFQETRDYVKKVMANTVHYSRLLGQGEAGGLNWLTPVPGRPVTPTEAPADGI